MARNLLCDSKTLKALICFLFLTVTIGCTNSARILDEVDPQYPVVVSPSLSSNPQPATVPGGKSQVGPTTTLPSGQIPATTTGQEEGDDNSPVPETNTPDETTPPVAEVAPVIPPVAESDDDEPDTTVPTSVAVTPPTAPTTTSSPSGPASVGTTNGLQTPVAPIVAPVADIDDKPTATSSPSGPASVGTSPQTPPLSFFMHDILGGSHPSARVVTGIIANTGNNDIPFSKPNNNFFPLQGGVPLNNININNIVNENNVPFLVGINGADSDTLLQNSGNSNIVGGGGNQPFVSAGQLPSGAILQQLMFGSLTVIDDELTEGHELGSSVIGQAQGFYLASSLDGTSQTIALTVLLHGDHEHDHVMEDTISLFGVHRTASPESQIAVIGGTGKYENAKGYATVETLHHQEDQHTTDGVDTIVHFSVYLSE